MVRTGIAPLHRRYLNTVVIWVCLVVGLGWLAARLTHGFEQGTTAPPLHRAIVVKPNHGKKSKQTEHHQK